MTTHNKAINCLIQYIKMIYIVNILCKQIGKQNKWGALLIIENCSYNMELIN